MVIIAAILFGFSWYQSDQQKKFIEARRVADSVALANAPSITDQSAASEGLLTSEASTQPAAGYGGGLTGSAEPGLFGAQSVEPESFTVENDVLSVEFSTLGGAIADVVLKDYEKYGGGELHMWKPGSELFDVEFFVRQATGAAGALRDRQINTRGELFTHAVTRGAEATQVSMRLPADSVAYFELLYTIPATGYMIDLDVRFVGMEDILSNQSNFEIDWASTSLQNEKGFDNENNYTTIVYRYPEVKGVEHMRIGRTGDTKTENEPGRVQWVAFKQHFFSTILIADDAFGGADMSFTTHRAGSGSVKDFAASMAVPMERGKDSYGFRLYVGPNKFSTLKEYDLGMERIIALGWMSFGWVSRGVLIPLFEWLSRGGMGIGWVILLMTIIIKLVIAPLTFTSYLSSAKMRVIKPEVDGINAKYPDPGDAMKKQQATMELYRKAGINPMAGCLPMLIQFPIIIAMFRFFPAAIELRGQSLWWAEDLSSYDSILELGFNVPLYGDHISLFALLMAASMFFYSVLNFKQQAAQPQMAGMKFMMLYMMPVMMLLWFNNYSSGLCYYYLLGNLFTIIQMYGARGLINEDKMRAKMMSRPAKAKKKSGFMQRLEEAQKAQIAAARAQQQAAQKGKRR